MEATSPAVDSNSKLAMADCSDIRPSPLQCAVRKPPLQSVMTSLCIYPLLHVALVRPVLGTKNHDATSV